MGDIIAFWVFLSVLIVIVGAMIGFIIVSTIQHVKEKHVVRTKFYCHQCNNVSRSRKCEHCGLDTLNIL